MAFDIMKGFKVGQALGAGQNSMTSFVSSLMDRIKSDQSIREKLGLAVAEQSALAPGKLKEG